MQENPSMGELIRFPDHQSTSGEDTRPMQVVAQRADQEQPHPGETTGGEDPRGGAELVPDTERGVLPAAVAGPAARARDHLRNHGWDYTRTGGKFLARHGYYLAGGMWDTVSSTYSRWTGRDIDTQIREAKAAGEHGVAAELLRQRTENKKLLLERIQVFGQFLVRLPKILAGLAAFTLGSTLIASVVAFLRPGGMSFADVWNGLFTALAGGFDWVVWAATVPLPLLLLASAGGLLVQGYHRRRRRQDVPGFLAAPGSAAHEVEITSSVVVSALQRSGIPALRRAIQGMDEHQRAAMLSPITLAGCGVEVNVTLPDSGDTTVTTEQVRAKRSAIAEGLGRHEHEVFITSAAAARTVTLWIADSGALDEPIGQSPLVADGFDKADIYSGKAPWGVTLRGDAFLLKLWQCHVLITGLSNQGKTAALRALLLWLLLDPSVEVHLADLKGVGDYNMLKTLVSTYIAGPSDEHVASATEMVEWGMGEMNRRIEVLEAHADSYPNGVTAELSRDPSSGFHPIVLVVDEAQVGYECPAKDDNGVPYGGAKANSRFFNAVRKIQNQGRAVNVTFWQGTQDPTNENLPIRARNGAHIRASLVVATPSQSRMALGDRAVDAGGAAPHELRQGKDKGVLVVKDADNTVETVRTAFVDGDAAEDIAERIAKVRGGVTPQTRGEPDTRDLLDDLAATFESDEDKVKDTDLVARLRKLAGGHNTPYGKHFTATRLRDQLTGLGVKAKQRDGYWFIWSHDVITARAGREVSEPD